MGFQNVKSLFLIATLLIVVVVAFSSVEGRSTGRHHRKFHGSRRNRYDSSDSTSEEFGGYESRRHGRNIDIPDDIPTINIGGGGRSIDGGEPSAEGGPQDGRGFVDMLNSVTDTVAGLANYAMNTTANLVTSGIDKASQAANYVIDKQSQLANFALNKGGDAVGLINTMAGKVGDGLQSAVERAGNLAAQTAQTLGTIALTAKALTGTAIGEAANTIAATAQKAADMVGSAAGVMTSAASGVKGLVEQGVSKVIDTAAGAAAMTSDALKKGSAAVG